MQEFILLRFIDNNQLSKEMNDLTHKKVKVEERYAVCLSFIYFFCVLGSYYILRPVRDRFAVEAGSEQLPRFFALTFVVALILTPVFSRAVSRWPRRIIVPLIYILFIICQMAFIPFFNNDDLLPLKTLGLIFFVYVSVFNLFVVSVFWSFMTDIWSDSQARRFFPVIALGGAAGAIAGPFITSILVESVGLSSLSMFSAALLLVAVVCIMLLGNWANRYGSHRFERNNSAAIEGSMWDGLRQIFTDPFVGTVSVMMVLGDAIETIAYVLITDYSGTAFLNDAIAQTRFAAHVDLSANILQFFLQLTVTRFLLVRYGAGSVFLISSGVVVFTCLAMGMIKNQYIPIFGIMPPVAIVMIVTRSLSHGMILPARETLFTLVPRSVRYKGKNAVDTVVWRAGDILSILSTTGLRSLGVGIMGFEMIWAGLAAMTGYIGWRLANRAEKGEFKEME